MRRAFALLGVVGCMAGASGLGGCTSAATSAPQKAATAVKLVASNVLRDDYAGSRECGDCHAAIAARFARSPMHNMTREAAGATLRAPAEATFDFKGTLATFTVVNGARHLRYGAHDFTITRVIGGRTREDFVGREGAGEEMVLPVSYVFPTGAFRYKGYSVMMKERPDLVAGPVWRKTCIFCHNTVPYLDTVFDDLGGDARRGYQGSPTDRLLPEDRLWKLVVTDAAGLARAVVDELGRLGTTDADAATPLLALLTHAIDETRKRFDAGHFVEEGIGCEACHLGSRAHALDPEIKPSLLPRSSLFRAQAPTPPSRAQIVTHTCMRCHTVLFSGYPWTWEGGKRGPHAGGSSINSGEARDFLLGACSSELTCTACHDPHGEDSRDRLAALGTVAGNGVCTSCHGRYARPADRTAHTHHAPDSAGSACLACHMARKNMGLDLEMTRYHRIGSPIDPARALRDRPLECALCHVDKSVGQVASDIERLWGKRLQGQRLLDLYGSFEANVISATLTRGLPHEQAAAAGALAEAGVRADELWLLLTHPYPLVRHFARRAIERIVGKPLAGVDLDAPTTKE